MYCRGLRALWSVWGQRFQLVVFLVLGTVFALLHHGLGVYLGDKSVPHDISICGMRISNQAWVSALSNALSQVVKFLFASTIGVAFAQYFFFWSGRKGSKVPRPHMLDAPLAAANGNPFTFSAAPTWCRSLGLAVTSLAMMSMIIIPIFVPGSIVPVHGNLWQPCTIRSPNTRKAGLIKTAYPGALPETGNGISARVDPAPPSSYWSVNLDPIFETTAIVNNIIIAGSHLSVPSPCGVCSYQINFTAASLDCSSINSTYNFSTNLPFNATNISVFNGELTNQNVLILAIRDGVVPDMNPPTAVMCNAFQAHYVVRVRHDNCASRIDVLNVTRGHPLVGDSDPSTKQLNGLIGAVGKAFTGRVQVLQRVSDNLIEGGTFAIAYSPLLRWRTTNGSSALTWSNLTTSLPSLMQNISLSFLSGKFPASKEPYMEELTTQCLVEQLVYRYNHNRLLSIYAAAWGAAATFFCLGLYLIVRRKQEHNLDFSHVIEELIVPSLESEKTSQSPTMGYHSVADEDDVGGVQGQERSHGIGLLSGL